MGVGCYCCCPKIDENCCFGFRCVDINTFLENNFCLSRCVKRQINYRKRGYYDDSKLFEDMCIFGSEIKTSIEINQYSSDLIDYKDALKSNNELLVLGLLGDLLTQNNIKFVIEKFPPKTTFISMDQFEHEEDQSKDISFLSLQFLSNLNMNKKKYDIHFDFGESTNELLLENKTKFEIFCDCVKNKLNKKYNIPKNEIIITYPQRGSFRVDLIFRNEAFDYLTENDLKEVLGENNYSDYLQLKQIKEIQSGIIMEACKLSFDIFDSAGNRTEWGNDNEYRGNMPYYPPR